MQRYINRIFAALAFLIVLCGAIWLYLHRSEPAVTAGSDGMPMSSQAAGAMAGMMAIVAGLIVCLVRYRGARTFVVNRPYETVLALIVALLIGGKLGSLIG